VALWLTKHVGVRFLIFSSVLARFLGIDVDDPSAISHTTTRRSPTDTTPGAAHARAMAYVRRGRNECPDRSCTWRRHRLADRLLELAEIFAIRLSGHCGL
jgi:hypothetical protein